MQYLRNGARYEESYYNFAVACGLSIGTTFGPLGGNVLGRCENGPDPVVGAPTALFD